MKGGWKPKATESFKVVKNNMTSKWYDKDGCEYTGDSNKKHTKCVSKSDYLLNKIPELEDTMATQEKAHTCI